MRVLLQLVWSFIKIGFGSFGGLSMVPLINDEMTRHGWMTVQELSDLVAIAEMTPGPLGINCATFAGIRTAGVLGAIAANLGVMVPSLTLAALAAAFFEKFKSSRVIVSAMNGIRPACVGLIFGVMLSLAQTNYVIGSSVSVPALIIGAIDALLLFKTKAGIPLVILFSAAAGLLCFYLPALP